MCENSHETDRYNAIERMRANDMTLRSICLVAPYGYQRNDLFAMSLAETESPIQSLVLHNYEFFNAAPMYKALFVTKAPLHELHFCQCMHTVFLHGEISWFLKRLPKSVQRLVIHDAVLTDENIAMFLEFARTTPEEEAVLYAIGQHAAKILRPLLHIQVECVRTVNCTHGQH